MKRVSRKVMYLKRQGVTCMLHLRVTNWSEKGSLRFFFFLCCCSQHISDEAENRIFYTEKTA